MTCSFKLYKIGKVFETSVHSEDSKSFCYCQNSTALIRLEFFVKRRIVTLVINNISVVEMTTDKCLINSKEWWSWKYRWNLRSDRIDLLTLDKISLICSLKVDFESKTNPKCFWAGQRLKELLLNVIDGWGTGFKF